MQVGLPLLLAGAGAGINAAAERNAAKERRGILNRAMEGTDQAREKATQQVLAEGQKFGGQERLQAMQGQEQTALAQALKDVGGTPQGGAGASVIDTAGGEGAVSGDFVKARADRALSEGDRLTSVARELSKVRAPGQLQQQEGLRRADLSERLGSAATSNRARVNAATLDADNVEAPWWGQAAKLATTAAALYASGGLSGGAGASPYALSGQGAQLGAQPASSFWGNTARIRFGG